MPSIIQSVLHGLQRTGAGRNNPKGSISHHSVGLQLWSKRYDIQAREKNKGSQPFTLKRQETCPYTNCSGESFNICLIISNTQTQKKETEIKIDDFFLYTAFVRNSFGSNKYFASYFKDATRKQYRSSCSFVIVSDFLKNANKLQQNSRISYLVQICYVVLETFHAGKPMDIGVCGNANKRISAMSFIS